VARPSKYPAEFRREAVRLALVTEESRAAVARRLGVNETTLRNWVAAHLAEEARGSDPFAIAASEREELRQLRKENAELRTEREILRKAAAYFRPGDDPVCRFRFVAEYRSAYGVKRLSRVLGVSRSGFYAWVRADPLSDEDAMALAIAEIRALRRERRRA
jgi:transposase